MKNKLIRLLQELAKKGYSEDIIADCILLPIQMKDKEKQTEELITAIKESKNEKDLEKKIAKIMN